MRFPATDLRTVLVLVVSTAIFSGCSGGGASVGTAQVSTQTQNPTLDTPSARLQATATGNVFFAIGFTPKPKATAGRVRPLYVSVSTQSLQILTDHGDGVVVNLSPSSPSCSPNPGVPGSYICTASLNVPAGDHVFTVTAYDLPNAKGKVLSTNTSGAVTVKATGTTTVPITLDGFVQYVNLTLATTTPPAGTAATIGLTAVLQDADRNLIVGPAPYEYPITLTTSDAADGPPSKTTLSSPADASGLTVKYNGASVKTIIYSATATGLPAANVMKAVLTPNFIPFTDTSTGALTTLLIGTTVYAFVPSSSNAYPNANGLLVEVPIINGNGVLGGSGPHGNPAITGTAGITACSGDQRHLRVYCVDGASANITVLDASVSPAKVTKTISTDATGVASNTGNTCHICVVAYDPTDDAAIIGTANGIEVYSSSGSHLSTTVADTSETFGYNPATNQVFNPEYVERSSTGVPVLTTPSIDVIDIKSRTRYTLAPRPIGLSQPDQGAVDSSTNIAISFEEFNNKGYYLVPIGAGTFNAGTNSFTEAKPVAFPFTSSIFNTCMLAATGIAVDTRIHVAFFNPEFCPDPRYGTLATVGAAQLPSSATASPSISSFAFAPMPNTPDGLVFRSGFDPHAQATVFGTFGDYGVSLGVDGNRLPTYLAVTDLKKLLAAPRSSDPTVISPSYDLIANKVVIFVPI